MAGNPVRATGNSAIVGIPRWRRLVLRGMVRTLFRLAARIEVCGIDRIPTGGALLVFNHLSNFDPPLFFAVVDRAELTARLASDYRERPFHRFWLRAAGALWIRRGASDRTALRQAIAHLQSGWIVGIAPEGTRSRDHRLHTAKPGAAFLASRASVPVLPVGITGTETLGRQLMRLRRGRITVRFGTPFTLPNCAGDRKLHLQAASDLLMCQAAALLRPEYRGAYADHPILNDLLASSGEPRARREREVEATP